jgi:hypothetical protein
VRVCDEFCVCSLTRVARARVCVCVCVCARSETMWSNRWDQYLLNTDSQIHWFSIINSVMIVLFLTGMVAMIMMRTLHADFRRYNQLEPNEEAEETGAFCACFVRAC